MTRLKSELGMSSDSKCIQSRKVKSKLNYLFIVDLYPYHVLGCLEVDTVLQDNLLLPRLKLNVLSL